MHWNCDPTFSQSMGLERAKLEASRAKSLEERQKSYEETRARIFSNGEVRHRASEHRGKCPVECAVVGCRK